MTCKPGEIWLVDAIHTDGSGSKRRPVVVVSNRTYIASLPDVLLVPLTTNMAGSKEPFTLIIQDWQQTGISKPSCVKPYLLAIDQRLLLKRLGRLSDSTFTALQHQIATWF